MSEWIVEWWTVFLLKKISYRCYLEISRTFSTFTCSNKSNYFYLFPVTLDVEYVGWSPFVTTYCTFTNQIYYPKSERDRPKSKRIAIHRLSVIFHIEYNITTIGYLVTHPLIFKFNIAITYVWHDTKRSILHFYNHKNLVVRNYKFFFIIKIDIWYCDGFLTCTLQIHNKTIIIEIMAIP